MSDLDIQLYYSRLLNSKQRSMRLLLPILLLLCGSVIAARWDKLVSIDEWDLTVNPLEKFRSHRDHFFDGASPNNMSKLVKQLRKHHSLEAFVNMMTSADVHSILANQNAEVALEALPLLNLCPGDKLEYLRADHIRSFYVSRGASFDKTIITRLSLVEQKAMFEALPGALQPYVSSEIIDEIIESGECNKLDFTVISTLKAHQGELLNPTCVARASHEHRFRIPEDALHNAPGDIFHDIKLDRIHPSMWPMMTVEQLADILSDRAPTEDHIRSVDEKNLQQALTLVMKDPTNYGTFSEELFTRIPAKMMPVFRAQFWEHANHQKPWTIRSDQLKELPSNAFAAVHPELLARLTIINARNDWDLFKSSRLGQILANLGTVERKDGFPSCVDPRPILKIADPVLFSTLSPTCISQIHPVAMSVFSSSAHLVGLSQEAVSSLSAEQVYHLPATSFTPRSAAFVEKLMEASKAQYFNSNAGSIGCRGLRYAQLAPLVHTDIWSKMPFECLDVLDRSILIGLDKKAFGTIRPEAFKSLSILSEDPDGNRRKLINAIFEKMSADQLSQLGIDSDDSTRLTHPCYNYPLPWIQSNTPETTYINTTVNPQCFALLAESSYKALTPEVVGLLSEDVFSSVTYPEKIQSMSPDALAALSKAQLQSIPSEALTLLTEDQLDALVVAKHHSWLSGEQFAAIPANVFASQLAKAEFFVDLPDDVLSAFTAKNMESLKSMTDAAEMFTIKQWNLLGSSTNDPDAAHACSVLKHQDILMSHLGAKGTTFWGGINTECLNNIQFPNELTLSGVSLIPDYTLGGLRPELKMVIKELLSDDDHYRLEMGNDCSRYTIEYLSELPDHHLQILPTSCFSNLKQQVTKSLSPELLERLPDHAIDGFTEEQISLLPVDAIEALTSSQWSRLGSRSLGLACSGITREQIASIPLQNLSGQCLRSISPSAFKQATIPQLTEIPANLWACCVTPEQISDMNIELWTVFAHWDAFSASQAHGSQHPCHGFSETTKSRLPPEALSKLQQACQGIDDDSGEFLEEAPPLVPDILPELHGGGGNPPNAAQSQDESQSSSNSSANAAKTPQQVLLEAVLYALIIVAGVLIVVWFGIKFYRHFTSRKTPPTTVTEAFTLDNRLT